jgi:hypothetical protein
VTAALPPTSRPAPHPKLRSAARWSAGPLCYLALSLWMWHSLLPSGLTSRTLAAGLLDTSIYIWWLAWIPHALLHGMNPFLSGYLQAPHGVNAMENSSMFALGVVMTPVTELFGAVASYNILGILGPPLSAWAADVWLRRYFGRIPAFVGGLVFGFSPIVVAHAHGDHLNLTWLVLVPLILMLAEDLLWRSERPVWPAAPLLGLLLGIQLLIGSEVLALTALGCLAMALLASVAYPHKVVGRLRVLLPAAGVTLIVGGAVSAWPLYEQFSARPAFVGNPVAQDFYTGRPNLLINPTGAMQFHTTASAALTRTTLSSIENGLYIGIPLLVVLAIALATGYRRRPVLIAFAIALVSLTVQLGWPDRIPGILDVPPLRVLQDHIRVMALLVPVRFAIIMWTAIAFIVADLLDRLRSWRSRDRRVAMGLVCLGLLPLLPGSVPFVAPVQPAPAFFTSSAIDAIPQGALVMLAPMATVWDTAPMLWQIDAGMRFRQIGGYMQHSLPGGGIDGDPYTPALSLLFGIDRQGRPYTADPSAQILADARAELSESGASAFVLSDSDPAYHQIQYALALQVLGRLPDRTTGGVEIWFLQHRA